MLCDKAKWQDLSYIVLFNCFQFRIVHILQFMFKNIKDLEKQEEAKLRAKYPDMRAQGASSFLQKRLSKGVISNML